MEINEKNLEQLNKSDRKMTGAGFGMLASVIASFITFRFLEKLDCDYSFILAAIVMSPSIFLAINKFRAFWRHGDEYSEAYEISMKEISDVINNPEIVDAEKENYVYQMASKSRKTLRVKLKEELKNARKDKKAFETLEEKNNFIKYVGAVVGKRNKKR